jgi:hypothetical protein
MRTVIEAYGGFQPWTKPHSLASSLRLSRLACMMPIVPGRPEDKTAIRTEQPPRASVGSRHDGRGATPYLVANP